MPETPPLAPDAPAAPPLEIPPLPPLPIAPPLLEPAAAAELPAPELAGLPLVPEVVPLPPAPPPGTPLLLQARGSITSTRATLPRRLAAVLGTFAFMRTLDLILASEVTCCTRTTYEENSGKEAARAGIDHMLIVTGAPSEWGVL